jgi:hypothetical protein
MVKYQGFVVALRCAKNSELSDGVDSTAKQAAAGVWGKASRKLRLLVLFSSKSLSQSHYCQIV